MGTVKLRRQPQKREDRRGLVPFGRKKIKGDQAKPIGKRITDPRDINQEGVQTSGMGSRCGGVKRKVSTRGGE